jgi:hypothetical protein
VSALAEALRRDWPTLDFAVAGLSGDGGDGAFPAWVRDLRRPSVDEDAERRWCARYAESHVVVGVHGSNMLLPSAHAGAVVELIGPERWGNFTQDILFRDSGDCRELLFRYRFLPDSTPPPALAPLLNPTSPKIKDGGPTPSSALPDAPVAIIYVVVQDLLREFD